MPLSDGIGLFGGRAAINLGKSVVGQFDGSVRTPLTESMLVDSSYLRQSGGGWN